MALNQGHEIDNCKVLDPEKRFMGFSWTFHGIFIKLMLVVGEVVKLSDSTKKIKNLYDNVY